MLSIDTIIRAIGGEAKPRAPLLQRGLRLPNTEPKVSRIEPCESLTLADPAAQIDSDVTDSPIDLETQHHLILSRQCTSDDGASCHRVLGGGNHMYELWCGGFAVSPRRCSGGGIVAPTPSCDAHDNHDD